jgi:hypothetical protein
MMRRIHGNKLRVLSFHNDSNKNDDIINGEETKQPTQYYMFGKAGGKSGSSVVTDTDMPSRMSSSPTMDSTPTRNIGIISFLFVD